MFKDQYGHESNDHYIFVPISVAGVTFKNGRRSRQTILRRIYWKDDPYQKVDGLDFIPVLFEDEPAVEVWVYNKKIREMIGYVPKKDAAFVYDHMSDFAGYFDFNVYGGGKGDDGNALSFGASVTLRFENKSSAQLVSSTPAIEKPVAKPIKPDPVLERAEKALSSSQPPRPAFPDIQRAVELFRTLYPDSKITFSHQLRGEGHYVGIHTMHNGQENRYIVQYDVQADAIDCYDIRMNLLSTTRPKTANSKRRHPVLWLLALFAIVLAVLYFFR